MPARARDQEQPTAVSVNARLTLEQHEYLRELADELNANLSAALRRAIDQSRIVDRARAIRRGDVEMDPPETAEEYLRLLLVSEPVDELENDARS